jgi:heme-binding protein
MWKKILRRASLALLALLVLIQAVPFGRDHSNPDARVEPAWDSPRTRELAARACFDCHSNETRWPWYSHLAPASWFVQKDVDDGRRHLNFSAWDRPQRHQFEAADELEEGSMPLWYYVVLHPGAKLSTSEVAELVRGFGATFGDEDGERGGLRQ